MLRRAWFVLAFAWAAVIFLNGSSRVDGPTQLDWILALTPFAVPLVLRTVFAFVMHGSDAWKLRTVRKP